MRSVRRSKGGGGCVSGGEEGSVRSGGGKESGRGGLKGVRGCSKDG